VGGRGYRDGGGGAVSVYAGCAYHPAGTLEPFPDEKRTLLDTHDIGQDALAAQGGLDRDIFVSREVFGKGCIVNLPDAVAFGGERQEHPPC